MTKVTVPEIMELARDTFQTRNAQYGDSYKHFGVIMELLVEMNGIKLTDMSDQDHNRFALVHKIIDKLLRYMASFQPGVPGHIDSVHDLGVYAFMLESIERSDS